MTWGYARGDTPREPAKLPLFLRAELEKIQRALKAPARTAVKIVTANLANNATESASRAIGMRTGQLVTITADRACWVRLYTSQPAMTNDANRALGTTASAGVGILAEFHFTGAGTVPCSPVPVLANDETPTQQRIWYAIENLSGGASPVTVTMNLLLVEP